MLPDCISLSAAGSSRRSASTNARREVVGASAGRGRHTRIMDEARAFVPKLTERTLRSVRMGQVPPMLKPLSSRLVSMVSQPVEVTLPLTLNPSPKERGLVTRLASP
jgi:hypothetical protein